MTVYCRLSRSRKSRCCACSPIAAQNSAASASITNISCTWRWRISTTAAPRPDIRKPTVSASASIAPFSRNSMPTAFRKKLYQSLDELQADLDDWLREYNLTRTHSGKY